jgi:hypothetical protein
MKPGIHGFAWEVCEVEYWSNGVLDQDRAHVVSGVGFEAKHPGGLCFIVFSGLRFYVFGLSCPPQRREMKIIAIDLGKMEFSGRLATLAWSNPRRGSPSNIPILQHSSIPQIIIIPTNSYSLRR